MITNYPDVYNIINAVYLNIFIFIIFLGYIWYFLKYFTSQYCLK